MKKWIGIVMALFITTIVFAQNNPLWMRYPSISPDGKNDCFWL